MGEALPIMHGRFWVESPAQPRKTSKQKELGQSESHAEHLKATCGSFDLVDAGGIVSVLR